MMTILGYVGQKREGVNKLGTGEIINMWGVSDTATHTGDTCNPDIHRLFIPKGQYNKFVRKMEKTSH